MSLTAHEYRFAWERLGAQAPSVNGAISDGTCVLETLSVGERFVWLEDFGHAVSYCRVRLLDDLTPPDPPGREPDGAHLAGGSRSLRRATPRTWRETHAGFAPEDLAVRWATAETALAALLDAFIADGYSVALGERLLAVVNATGFGLELAGVYALPDDLSDVLEQAHMRFAWWDDGIDSPEQERQPFDFDDPRHRAILALHLRAENAES